MEQRTILVTGATGFIGRRLVTALLQQGAAVRCLTRRPGASIPSGCEAATGDLLRPEGLAAAFRGVDTAYYLIHSLGTGRSRFAAEDRQAACNFVSLAEDAGVRRVIYLSGLGERGAGLSDHLASRLEVAEILAAGTFQTTVLRAAIIIGADGASYELIRFLVKTQPLLLQPPWLETRCQPIALADVVAYLAGCLEEERTAGAFFDIGGPEIFTYKELLERFARVAGEVNLYLPIPFPLPGLASRLIGLIGPLRAPVTEALLEGLKNEVICREDRIRELLPIKLTPFDAAVRLALEEGVSPAARAR